MSLLLKQWWCVDDQLYILSELEYRVHTSTHPDHKIIAAEDR